MRRHLTAAGRFLVGYLLIVALLCAVLAHHAHAQQCVKVSGSGWLMPAVLRSSAAAACLTSYDVQEAYLSPAWKTIATGLSASENRYTVTVIGTGDHLFRVVAHLSDGSVVYSDPPATVTATQARPNPPLNLQLSPVRVTQ